VINRQQKAYIYAFISILLWSSIATALTITLRGMDKIELLLWSFLTSFVVLGIMIIVSGKIKSYFKYLLKYWKIAIFLGIINPFIYYLTLFYAYELLPAQEAQAINYTWALMLSYLSVPVLGHKLNKLDIFAGIICYMGIIIIATHGNLYSLEFSNFKGVFIALLSTIFWALYWVSITKNREDILMVLFSNFGVGLVLIIVYILIFSIKINIPEPQVLFGAVYIGLFEMGISFILWAKALSLTYKVSSIANLIFLSPILSLFFIYFIAGEKILNSTIIALVLILFGLYIQQRDAHTRLT